VFLCPPSEERARPSRFERSTARARLGYRSNGTCPEISGPHRHLICGCRRTDAAQRAAATACLSRVEFVVRRKNPKPERNGFRS
jgi:hypothetical protein